MHAAVVTPIGAPPAYQVTSEAMTAIATHRRDRARPLTWIEIGSVGHDWVPTRGSC